MSHSNPFAHKDAPEPDDLSLVRQAQQGDLNAFTALYERHLPAVYNRVRYVVPEQDVEDVTQEIFIAVMKSIKRFKGDAQFTTWLRTLTNRRVADYYRKRSRRAEVIDTDVNDVDSNLSANLQSKARTNTIDDQMLLNTALLELPEHYREVLLMRFAEGLKFREIAHDRKQSLDATKSLYRRAIEALRQEVGETDG